MSEKLQNLKESLSALMDNEADDLELRRVLKSLSPESTDQPAESANQNQELLATWDRYHQVRSTLHSEASSQSVPADFMSKLKIAIAEEPELVLPATDSRNRKSASASYRWLSAFGQGAVAASVAALVMVFSFNAINSPEGVEGAVQTASTQTGSAETADFSQVANISGKLDEDSLARLRQAVYREFEEDSQSMEIPVSYNFERE